MADPVNHRGDQEHRHPDAQHRRADEQHRRADERNGRGSEMAATEPHRASDLLRVTVVAPPASRAGAEPALQALAGPLGADELDGVSLDPLDPPRARLLVGGGEHDLLLAQLPDPKRAASGVRRMEVVVDGWRFEVDVESDARARLRERATSVRGEAGSGGPVELRAIIPGRVVSVDVAQGDAVEAGGRLLVVEAMKMQNELRAPRAGRIGQVAVGPGQTVELGDVLLVIE